MGCDIHPHAYGQNEDGTWTALDGRLDFGRSYFLWTVLTGVVRKEDGVKSILDECRGLPEDMGKLISGMDDAYNCSPEFDGNGVGEHSFSWLTYKEILDWPHWADKVGDVPRYKAWENDTYAGFCSPFLELLAAIFSDRDPERCRLIFGFDS